MNWKGAYLESRVLSAGPVELVSILYEHAIDSVQDALEHLAHGDIRARSNAISKAIAILAELESSLDYKAGGEIAANLANLYRYMRERLVTANVKQDAAPLREVENLLKTVGEAWSTIRAQGKPASTRQAPGSAWGNVAAAESSGAYRPHDWTA